MVSEPAPARPQDARLTAKNFQKSVFGLYLGSIRDQEIMIGLVRSDMPTPTEGPQHKIHSFSQHVQTALGKGDLESSGLTWGRAS